MKRFAILIIIVLLLCGCHVTKEVMPAVDPVPTPTALHTPTDNDAASWTVELFMEGIVSQKGTSEYTLNIWGDQALFVRFGSGIPDYTAFEMHRIDGQWQAPVVSPLFQDSGCYLPAVDRSGQWVYYIPRDGLASYPPQIWVRPLDDHSDPQYLFDGMYPSIADSGHLYYELNGRFYVRQSTADGFGPPMRLTGDLHSGAEDGHPCISWDETYLIFDSSQRPGVAEQDLFISYRLVDGTWSAAVNLGQYLGMDESGLPRISADGAWIFFYSEGDVYRVSTDVVDAVRRDTLN